MCTSFNIGHVLKHSLETQDAASLFSFFHSTESGGVADEDKNNLFIKICLPTEGFM